MPSGVKDVLLGMLVGMSAAALAAIAIYFSAHTMALPAIAFTSTPALSLPLQDPTQTLTSPATPTEAASFTPVPTLTQIGTPAPTKTALPPTPTPDAVQNALDNGALAFAGPLSNDEQIALYRSSLNYIRATSDDSKQLAKQINGVGYGDPTNICGPLAIAILRDAKLTPSQIAPHDFWLLNPNAATDAKILERAFPWENYSHVIIAAAINRTDWRASPLVPGDFLFIWHGSGGNFDHMLVVTRVDSQSRAYAVTNYGTSAGYVIAEALLYDPNDATVGLFHQWTQERDAILGSTGFGGFEVWRRRSP